MCGCFNALQISNISGSQRLMCKHEHESKPATASTLWLFVMRTPSVSENSKHLLALVFIL